LRHRKARSLTVAVLIGTGVGLFDCPALLADSGAKCESLPLGNCGLMMMAATGEFRFQRDLRDVRSAALAAEPLDQPLGRSDDRGKPAMRTMRVDRPHPVSPPN
jgi:hypothetical protein